jgi:hypothetical protein
LVNCVLLLLLPHLLCLNSSSLHHLADLTLLLPFLTFSTRFLPPFFFLVFLVLCSSCCDVESFIDFLFRFFRSSFAWL